MKKQEAYWSFRAADTPELADLPKGTFAGTESEWNSLSPGYRREIYRSALKRVPTAHEAIDIDLQRIARADLKHAQGLVAIRAREAL